MTKPIERRAFVKGIGAGAAIAGAATVLGAPSIARASNPIVVKTATLSGGWANLVNAALKEGKFDIRNGVNFEAQTVYNRLGTYYADLIKGSFQIGVASWVSVAKMNMRGAPMGVLGTVATGSMAGFFSRQEGPQSFEEFKGKTLAAMGVSGTYAMAKAWAKAFDNFDFDQDAKLQNAPNPPAVATLVAAKRADFGLVWEHTLSAALNKVEGSKVILTLNDYYRKHTNRDMPYSGIGVNRKAIEGLPKDTVERATAAYRDVFEWISSNPDKFAAMGPGAKIDPSIIERAISSGRMRYGMRSVAEDNYRQDLEFAANILTEHGALPKKLGESYFVG